MRTSATVVPRPETVFNGRPTDITANALLERLFQQLEQAFHVPLDHDIAFAHSGSLGVWNAHHIQTGDPTAPNAGHSQGQNGEHSVITGA